MRLPVVHAPLVRVAVAAIVASHLAACASVQRQGLEPLVTDRPDFTESSEVVGRGLVQIESGTTFANASGERSNSLGEVLIRAGYADRGELRVGLNSYTYSRFGDGSVRGLEDMSLGTKVKLLSGGGTGSWIPTIAVIGATSIPTGSSVWRADKLQPEVKLGFAWDFTDRVAFSSNLNYSWVRERFENWGEPAASASLGFGLTDKVGSYVEYYGFYPQYYGSVKSHYLNGGVTYGLSDDLQLDARVGQGVARSLNGPDYFFGLGVSRRW